MSVLIKDMRMPSSCANCEWSKLSKMDLGLSCYCMIAKKCGSIESAKNGRMNICPLVEIEEKTGFIWENNERKEITLLFPKSEGKT